MSASYLLAAAAAIPPGDEEIWTSNEVRNKLARLARDLEPGDTVEYQASKWAERMPLTSSYLAEAIGRLIFRAEVPATDYGRCVQVSQMLGDAANHMSIAGDEARANLLREYAHAVSQAGEEVRRTLESDL